MTRTLMRKKMIEDNINYDDPKNDVDDEKTLMMKTMTMKMSMMTSTRTSTMKSVTTSQ